MELTISKLYLSEEREKERERKVRVSYSKIGKLITTNIPVDFEFT